MRKYLITISHLRGHQLPKKDIFNKSDTYLIIYWPNTKPVRTDIIYKNSNPKWEKFQHSLEYVLEEDFGDSESIQRFLRQQLLRIECYAKHSLRKDSIIGTATVDLLLCLGGPTDHQITLLSERLQDAGSLEFKITARCIGTASIALRDVTCNLNPSEKKQHLYLRSFLSSNNNAEMETSICFWTRHPYWASVGPFEIEGDLQMVMNSTLTIHLFAREEDIVRMKGVVNISLGKYNTASEEFIFFRENVVEQFEQSQNSLGMLEGYIVFSNLPVPCQMWKGYHKDGQIFGAAPLTTGLYDFPDINVDKLPPVYDLYHSGHLVENTNLVLDEECQNQLRGIIERINCDEDVSEALCQLIEKFEENAETLQEAFYQVGGVSVMVSLLQNSLDMLPLTLTAGNIDDSSEGQILPSIAQILFLALHNCQKNQAFLCRSKRIDLLLRFLERTSEKTGVLYLLRVIHMIASRDLSGQEIVVECGGVPVVSKILLHFQHDEITLACMQALSAMAFGIYKTVVTTSQLIRNTGALFAICKLLTLSAASIDVKQEALRSISVICHNYPPLQTEVVSMLFSSITEWSFVLSEDLWSELVAILRSWLIPSSSVASSAILFNPQQMKSLLELLQHQPALPANIILTIEDLTCALMANASSPEQFSSLLSISSFRDISYGFHLLSRMAEINAHREILVQNMPTLLYHYDQTNDIALQTQIISIIETFGTRNEETLPLLFPAFVRFLHQTDENMLLQCLTSLYNIFSKQQERIEELEVPDFPRCVQQIGEIFFSLENAPGIQEEIEKLVHILIRYPRSFSIFFPLIKVSLPREELVIACRAASLLRVIVSTCDDLEMILACILHSMEHILPLQLQQDESERLEQLQHEYLQILSQVGTNAQFRSKLFLLWPSVYLQPQEETLRLPLFVFQVLDCFVGVTEGPCVFGMSVVIVQQLVAFWLAHCDLPELMDVLCRTMNHVTDFQAPAISFLHHAWSSVSQTEQEHILMLLQRIIRSQILLTASFYEFAAHLIHWKYTDNITHSPNSGKHSSTNLEKKEETSDDIDTMITLLITDLFAQEETWNVLLPAMAELVGVDEEATLWVIERILHVGEFLRAENEEISSSILQNSKTVIEAIGVSKWITMMSSESPHRGELLDLVRQLQKQTPEIEQNVLDSNDSTEQYQAILQAFIDHPTPKQADVLIAQCNFIFWVIAKISPVYLLRQFAKIPMLSLVTNVLTLKQVDALHGPGLLAFSNVLQKIPSLLIDLPESFFDMKKLVDLLCKHAESVPAVCRLVLQLFNDPRFQKEFVHADGFFQLSKVMEELEGHLQSSPVARESLCEALSILVFAARIPRLRMEIIGDGLIPVVLNILNLTRVEEIIKNVLSFINFMSSESIARREMIDSRDIDSLSAIIDQKETYPELSKNALDCYVRLGGLTTLCRVVTNPEPEYQEFYRCRTCGLNDGICIHCAEVCHRGHGLSSIQSGTMICTCGISPNCLIRERPSLRVQVPLQICSFAFTGPHYTEQAWFFCRTCFRNEQKGVCTTCAYVCHKGHDVRFGSESRFYCDCSDRYGVSCKCAQHVVVAPDNLPRFRKPRHVEEEEEEEEEDETDEDETCIVCMDQPKDALFYKCGHIAACMDCACMLKQRNDPCVICRESIDSVVRTFFV